MSDLKNQIVVTGGAGYIGSHTVIELIIAGFEPIIIDDFRNSKPWILDRLEEISGVRSKHYAIDCCDEDALLKIFQENKNIGGVIHFAAYKAVGESVEHPVMYYQNNIDSLCSVLNVMKAVGINNLVFSSSCTVYGEPSNPVVTEDTPIQSAASPYGATKIACEQLIEFTSNAQKDFQGTLLRYFNPIGAHEFAKIGELPQGIPNNLVPFITQTAKGIRDQVTVFGDDYDTTDGTCLRDYIHVVDLAKAHVKAIEWAKRKEGGFVEAFNLGTGKGSSVLEIINTFEEVNELKVSYKIGPRRAGDVEQIFANPSKAESELNWSCEYSLADALKHSWNWEKNVKNS